MESKGNGDTYASHSGSKKKLKETIVAVQPVWTNYFDLATTAEEEDVKDRDGLPPVAEEEEEKEEEIKGVPQRQRSQRLRQAVEYKELEDRIENDDKIDEKIC